MRILPISQNNTNFNGLSSKIENTAATVSSKKKVISVQYHNALVKLTAWRTFFFTSTIFGVLGYQTSDKLNEKNVKNLSNTVQLADIDTNAPVEIKDVNQNGNKELILKKNDGSSLIIDLTNMKAYTEATGLKEVK